MVLLEIRLDGRAYGGRTHACTVMNLGLHKMRRIYRLAE